MTAGTVPVLIGRDREVHALTELMPRRYPKTFSARL
jgi:hypothetical protein